ncbi:MAG: hypothetical protein COA79_22685 [Planctomycetota bacterium]|nr:MAG: hypothetical protein COA79_22685 [Planctomycetota bacterium]
MKPLLLIILLSILMGCDGPQDLLHPHEYGPKVSNAESDGFTISSSELEYPTPFNVKSVSKVTSIKVPDENTYYDIKSVGSSIFSKKELDKYALIRDAIESDNFDRYLLIHFYYNFCNTTLLIDEFQFNISEKLITLTYSYKTTLPLSPLCPDVEVNEYDGFYIIYGVLFEENEITK